MTDSELRKFRHLLPLDKMLDAKVEFLADSIRCLPKLLDRFDAAEEVLRRIETESEVFPACSCKDSEACMYCEIKYVLREYRERFQ
jgi:hypothetical protein